MSIGGSLRRHVNHCAGAGRHARPRAHVHRPSKSLFPRHGVLRTRSNGRSIVINVLLLSGCYE
jgi:hypothetical protein